MARTLPRAEPWVMVVRPEGTTITCASGPVQRDKHFQPLAYIRVPPLPPPSAAPATTPTAAGGPKVEALRSAACHLRSAYCWVAAETAEALLASHKTAKMKVALAARPRLPSRQ